MAQQLEVPLLIIEPRGRILKTMDVDGIQTSVAKVLRSADYVGAKVAALAQKTPIEELVTVSYGKSKGRGHIEIGQMKLVEGQLIIRKKPAQIALRHALSALGGPTRKADFEFRDMRMD